MGRRRKNDGEKEKRRKRIAVQLLKREHAGEVTRPYKIMEELLESIHGHLRELTLAIAWRLGWRADVDGHLRLGQLKKRGDLDRELDSYDFVILLNKEAWPTLNEDQQTALIDHELCHAQIVFDSDGEPKLDDRSRQILRVRRHDVEEFKDVIDRRGFYTSTLSEFAKAAIADLDRPLLRQMEDEQGDGEHGDGQSATEAEVADPETWKGFALKHLQIKDKHRQVLEDNGYRRMGRLFKHMDKQGTSWNKDINGIGDAGKEEIETAWLKFWEEHPEFYQAAKT